LIDDLTGGSEGASPRRRYSGGEVDQIVKRASELEATAPTQSGAMTIGGVEALAAEVGIKPDLVRQAAQEVRQRSTPQAPAEHLTPNQWIGGPTRIYFERVVDVEVPEAEFPTMVEEIRRLVRNVGQVSQLGRSFSWGAVRGTSRRDLEVAVSVRGGRTRITIQENLNLLIGAVYGGIGGGMGGGGMGPIMGILGGALNFHPPALLAIVPFWLATTFVTARTVYRKTTRKRVRELEALADRLAEFARDLVPEPRPLPRAGRHQLP
jgi:hypothetical protein